MNSCVFYITCDNQWRYYHLFECDTMGRVADVIHKRNLLADMDICYGSDLEYWSACCRTEPVTLTLLEKSALVETHDIHADFWERNPPIMGNGTVFSGYCLGRLRFVLQPTRSRSGERYLCETVELVQATDYSEARKAFALSGKTKEKMHYFNCDLGFDGETHFTGVATVMPAIWPGNGVIAVEPITSGSGSLWDDTLSEKDRRTLLDTLTRTNVNRSRKGLDALVSDSGRMDAS